jgi:class 3 adenylate cyclase/tetratricopeptide (TPR) repeat protein
MPSCPNCGQENPDHARFCLSCGSALGVPAPQVEERKIVSILFADLVGFTARSDQADPEDVRAALRPYHAMLKREIERYGGTVEKFIGDAVMAAFGAPISREDDAERAVRAALRIVEEIPVLNEEHQGLDLAVRVAVNTGEGLVNVAARPEHGESLVTGDVVNTAARLQTVAPVGGVVVGEATQRTTRDLFEYESLDPASLKGKAEPVPLWRAVRARGGYRRGIEASDATPFVGRELERTLLQQAFLRTIRERAVQLVTVTGEPGVGKSRLIHEFFRFVDDRPDLVWWRHGRCLPYGEGVSFWALGEIVKSQAGILESDGPREVTEKLAEAVMLAVENPADREWVVSRLGSLVGVATDVPADRSELFAAWRAFLEAMASARPLVLVFEDLHWADEAMLEFIEHLVEWSSGVPILVLCTARPELYEKYAGWGGGQRNAVTIALSPLTPDENDELISALLGGDELDSGVRQSLQDRSGGNPLFAEEFIRLIRERPSANGNGAAQVSVPETVHALIAARLDTLPPERKTLLHDASVVGRVFWAGAVAHIAGIGQTDVRAGLHDLSRKELVRPVRGSSVKDEAEYSFWHALVRDVAYGQIPRGPRSQKHRAAAEWIERLAGERVADHAEVLVHHYREATSLARAAGLQAEVIELDSRLRTYLVMAGNRTAQLDARRAHAYFAEALDLYPKDDPERPAIIARAAQAAYEWGDFDIAERLAGEAAEAYRAAGDEKEEAAILIVLDDISWLRHGTRRKTLIERARSLLERHAPSAELARVQGVIGYKAVLGGDLEEGIRWLDTAVRLAETLDQKELWARVLLQRGPARLELGDPGGADDLREAVRLGLETGQSRPTEVAYNNLADTLYATEGPSVGIETYRRAIEFGERRGLVQPAEWSASEMTRPLYEAGEWDELLAIADAILSPTSRLQQNRSQGALFASISRARVLARRGSLDEDLVAEFLPRAREVGDLQILIPALVVASVFEAAHNRRKEAVALVEEFEKLTGSRPLWRALELCEAVRIEVWAGLVDRSPRLVEGIRSTTARDRCSAAGANAAIAEATTAPDEAARLYRIAAVEWQRFGHVVENGFALLGEGRCLVKLDLRAEATEPLGRARVIFQRLNAAPLVAEVDALLR